MSLREILDEIAAATRREKRRQSELTEKIKTQALLLYQHAQLAAIATWNGKRYPKKEAVWPALFAQESDDCAPGWKRQQAGMAAWVAAYNERVRRGVSRNV